MTNPETAFVAAGLTPAPRADAVQILRRVALPFFLFSAVLFGFLLLSWIFLVPRLTRIEVAGSVRGEQELEDRREELRREILAAERSRENLILAIHQPQYLALKAAREGRLSLPELRVRLDDIAKKTVDQQDAIHVSALAYDVEAKTVKVEGDVRFVGSRSMTVLAEYVENLRSSPAFASVSTPTFLREDDPITGAHSPFSLTITLP
jgi:hypothetical protein